jgi:hypothetical protein
MAVDAEPTTVVTTAELERLYAAEETCWSLLLAITFAGMNRVPMGWRNNIVNGGFQRWADLSAEQGLFPDFAGDLEDDGSS